MYSCEAKWHKRVGRYHIIKTTYIFAHVQAISCVLREFLPPRRLDFLTGLLHLLGHEEETPPLQIPGVDFFLIACYYLLQ
jgi:hypothetical protein